MDPAPELPADVQKFLEDQIDTVPHMEALLLLWESAPNQWDADQIASRIYVPPEAATQILRDLARRKLVCAIDERFAYDSTWDERGTLMSNLPRRIARIWFSPRT
jgi:hypothetical protein